MIWPDEWDHCHQSVERDDTTDACGEPPVAAARCNDDGDRDPEGRLMYPVCLEHVLRGDPLVSSS